MKKILLILTTILLNSILPISVFAQEYEDYAWVLIGAKEFDGSDQVSEIERMGRYETDEIQADSTYKYGEAWKEYSMSATFYGKTNTAEATISDGWETIYPGKPINLNISLKTTAHEIDGAASVAEAYYCKPESGLNDGGDPDFTDESGKSRFESDAFNGFLSHDTNVSASIGVGKPGEKIAICARAHLNGVSMGTNYIYEWMDTDDRPRLGGIGRIEVPKDEKGDYIDSGVRISDVSGEVMIRHGDDPLGWEVVDIGTIVYEGDVIETKRRNSTCVLSLTDMTTFKMKGFSDLIIITRSEEESKLKLLAGKVYANVKKMIKDGTMEVEMSQAVAGIKGTRFVLTESEDESQIEVIEGSVEFISKSNNSKVTVNAGEAVIADKNGLSPKTTFYPQTLEAEINQEEDKNNAIPESGEASSEIGTNTTKTETKSDNSFAWISLGIIFIISLAFLWKMKFKSRKQVSTV